MPPISPPPRLDTCPLPSPVLTEPTASCKFGNRAGRCDSSGDGVESEMGCCTGSKGKASIGAGAGAGKDGGGGQLSHGPVSGGWRCGRVARGGGVMHLGSGAGPPPCSRGDRRGGVEPPLRRPSRRGWTGVAGLWAEGAWAWDPGWWLVTGDDCSRGRGEEAGSRPAGGWQRSESETPAAHVLQALDVRGNQAGYGPVGAQGQVERGGPGG
jgi:hypothetical protein